MKSKDKLNVTLEILRANNACTHRYDHLVKKLGTDWKDSQSISLLRILDVNGIEDCFWAFQCFEPDLGKSLTYLSINVAIFSAEKVLFLFEKQYPDVQAPRKAIEAAKQYLANPSAENKKDAYTAYAAAHATADTARASIANAAAYATTRASIADAAAYATDYATNTAAATYAAACAATNAASAAATYDNDAATYAAAHATTNTAYAAYADAAAANDDDAYAATASRSAIVSEIRHYGAKLLTELNNK